MKTFLCWLILLTVTGCERKPVTTPAAPPTNNRQVESGFDPKIDLGGKPAEEYDWDGFFARADQSTGSRWSYAAAAHEVMRERLDQLCSGMRKTLSEKQDHKALETFNRMQELWEQAAAAEIAFVGSEYEGGSEAKVSFASHRFKVDLRRVRELLDLGGTAHFFQ